MFDTIGWFTYNSLDIMLSSCRLMDVIRTCLTQWSRATNTKHCNTHIHTREGDKTERTWSSEEFTELRLTLATLWALQGGLSWHTLHTHNTHGGSQSELPWIFNFTGLFGLLEERKGRDHKQQLQQVHEVWHLLGTRRSITRDGA